MTSKKLLGANYGFMVAPPFSTTRPERAALEPVESDWGFNDTYVVPLYLGWHLPRLPMYWADAGGAKTREPTSAAAPRAADGNR